MKNMDKGSFVVGMKQTLAMIDEGVLERVFVALDADAFVTREVIEAAENKNIPISYVESMKRLGRQFGIDIGAACAGVLLQPDGMTI